MKDPLKIKGSYVIKKWCSITGKLLWQSKPIENLVVNGTGYGRNIIVNQLAGVTTYPIAINSASIGTGTNVPADSDTGLQTSVLSGILVSDTVISSNMLTLTFYITDAQLANGTYREFGVFCTGRLFARSLITPVFTKGSNQNISVDYTFTLTT